jgi:hypothetical protein
VEHEFLAQGEKLIIRKECLDLRLFLGGRHIYIDFVTPV